MPEIYEWYLVFYLYETGVAMVNTLLGLIEHSERTIDELPELSIVVRDTTMPYDSNNG